MKRGVPLEIRQHPAYVRFERLMGSPRDADGEPLGRMWFPLQKLREILKSDAFKEFAALFPREDPSRRASRPRLAAHQNPACTGDGVPFPPEQAQLAGESTAAPGGTKE